MSPRHLVPVIAIMAPWTKTRPRHAGTDHTCDSGLFEDDTWLGRVGACRFTSRYRGAARGKGAVGHGHAETARGSRLGGIRDGTRGAPDGNRHRASAAGDSAAQAR